MAKQKLKQILLILGLFVFMGQILTVSADFDPVQRNRKTLLIHPFNPLATGNNIVGKYDNQWYTTLNQGNALVDNHLSFKNQYLPQPPLDSDTPVKAGAEEKSGPDTQHNHAWFNDSVEDNFYYLAVLDSYEITLAPDVLKNIDLNSLRCYTPTETKIFETPCFDPTDMNKPYLSSDFYGITRITFNQSTGTITWKFVATGGPGRPVIMGKNPGLNFVPDMPKTTGAGDQSDKWNRSFEGSVSMTTKNNPEKIWSATTSSRALVRYEAIAKSAVNSTAPNYGNLYTETCVGNGTPQAQTDNYSHWCSMTPQQVGSTNVIEGVKTGNDGKTYYWEQIATVSTVWKKPTTPPPSSFCTSLSITKPGAPTLKLTSSPLEPSRTYEMTPSTETTFEVLPSFSNGEVPLDYKWEATSLKYLMSASLDPVKGEQTKDGYAATLLAATPQLSTGSQIGNLEQVDIVKTSIFTTHGFFSDDGSKKDLANPYIDANNFFGLQEDRSTYYTGGPAGTLIRVQGVNPDTGNFVGNNCESIIVIPSQEEENTCIDLEINPTSLDEKTPTTFTVTPKFEKDTPIINLDYTWSTKEGTSGFTPGHYDLEELNNFAESLASSAANSGSAIDNSTQSTLKPSFDATNLQPSGGTSLSDEIKKPDVQYEEVKIPNTKPTPDPINEFKVQDFQTNLLAAAPGVTPLGSTPAPTYAPNAGASTLMTAFFNKFTDSSTATDYANPYTETESTLADDRSTYYTGGNAGTIISVQAFNKQTKEIYPLCKADLQIPPEMTNFDKCLDATIVQGQTNPTAVGDEVALEDPIEGLWVRVNTDPAEYEADLTFDWEVKGGGELYENDNNFGTRVSTTNFANTVDLTGAQEGTRVTVAAVDPENNLENIEICKDDFTVTASPQLMCRDLRLSPIKGKVVFGPGLMTYLSAKPINTDDSLVSSVDWYEEGPGHFEKAPGSIQSSKFPYLPSKAACPDPNKYVSGETTSFTAPARCDYFYVAGDDGGGLVRVSANPNLGDSENCIFEAKVSTPPNGKPVECLSLNFDQNSLLESKTQTLTGDVTFTDGLSRDVEISWSGENVAIADPNPQSSSSLNFSKQITANPAPGSVTAVVTATSDPDVDVASLAQCTDTLSMTPEEDDCREIEFNYDRKPGYICIDVVEGTYEKVYAWWIEGDKIPEEGDCIREEDFNEDDYLVYAEDFPSICRLENRPDQEEKTPPEFQKLVSQTSPAQIGYRSTLSAGLSQTENNEFIYKLTFTSRSDNTSATITDPDMINGIEGTLLPAQYAHLYEPGTLKYIPGSTRVVASPSIPVCDEKEDEKTWNNCYRPDSSDIRYGIDLIKLDDNTKVTITYRAEIKDSPIMDPNICRDGKVCEEYYINKANATWKIIGSSEEVLDRGTLGDEARIQAFCQYILTRAAGDIFLETDLGFGVDINKCSEFTTSTGVIVTPGQPDKPGIVSSGAPVETTKITSINHEICSEGQAGELGSELSEFYGQGISENLSSQICEVKLQTGSPWKQEIITNSIEENKLRLSRWGADYPTGLTLYTNTKTEDVTYVKGDLKITNNGYELDKGAKTFIVEDGNLIINGDITYKAQQTYQSVRDTASLAFIVLNGNVIINNNVKTIAGVYFVQEGKDPQSGQLVSSPDTATYNPLIVYGSIYGDIEPLFGNRLFAGDPSEDAGGIVIRFDQRILLNTPPGLRDVLDVSQTEVAR